MNLCPTVCIFSNGVISAESPKSYVYVPRVVDGTALGSQATNSASDLPFSFSPKKG